MTGDELGVCVGDFEGRNVGRRVGARVGRDVVGLGVGN